LLQEQTPRFGQRFLQSSTSTDTLTEDELAMQREAERDAALEAGDARDKNMVKPPPYFGVQLTS